MTPCGYSYFPDPWVDEDPNDKAWSCQEEATFTCCDYGGKVCEKHKCRCSRPLHDSKVENILAAVLRKKAILS